jgi:hypothetical protein
MRRIVMLEEGGWVIVERSAAAKHRLLPTWGRDHNRAIRPWRFDSHDTGRPSRNEGVGRRWRSSMTTSDGSIHNLGRGER